MFTTCDTGCQYDKYKNAFLLSKQCCNSFHSNNNNMGTSQDRCYVCLRPTTNMQQICSLCLLDYQLDLLQETRHRLYAPVNIYYKDNSTEQNKL